MKPTHRHRPLFFALALALACAPPAMADNGTPLQLNLAIAAQPLGQALNVLARESGRPLIVDAILVAGRQAAALHGRMPLEEALRRLLAGSGLQWRVDGKGGIFITSAPRPQVIRTEPEEPLLPNIVVKAAVERVVPNEVKLGREELNIARSIGNAEIFSSQTNVQLNNIRNEAGAMDVGIRNLQGEGRVPVIIDGSLQSTHTNRGYQGASDRTYIDAELISSAKVSIGASHTPFSAGAIGGLVQIQTLEPSDVILAGQKSGVMVKGSTYNNNKHPSIGESATEQEYYVLQNGMEEHRFRNGALTLAGAHRFERADILVAWSRRATGNYFAGKQGHSDYVEWKTRRGLLPGPGWVVGDIRYAVPPVIDPGQEVPNTSFSSESTLLKSNLKISDEQRLKFTWRHHKQEAGEIYSADWARNTTNQQYQRYPAGVVSVPQWALGTADISSYSSQYSFHSHDTSLINLNVGLWGSEAHMRQRNGMIAMQATGAEFGDQYLHKFSNTRHGVHIVNRAEFEFLPLNLDLGASFNQESIRPESRGNGLRRVALGNGLFLDENRSGARNADRKADSLFARAELRLGKHTLQLGSSVQNASIHDHNTNTTSHYNGLVDFNGELILRPFPWLDLHGLAARAWRPPSLHEGSRSSEVFNRSLNRPLHPEEAHNFEVGGMLKFAGLLGERDRLNFQAKYFDNRIKNFLTQGDLTKNQSEYIFLNYDLFHMRGTELNLDYQHPRFFLQANSTHYRDPKACSEEIAAHLNGIRDEAIRNNNRNIPAQAAECNSMGFAASLLPSRIQPKTRYVLTVGTRLLEGRLMLGTRLRYHSGKENPQDWLKSTAANPILNVPAGRLIDLFAEYRFNHHLSAGLHVANLANRYQVDPGSLVSMPVPGRTVRLSLEARF